MYKFRDGYNNPYMIYTGQYKLGGRFSHQTQVIGDTLYLWGGGQPNLPDVHNSDEKKRISSQLQIFDITSGEWDTTSTRGNPPLGVMGYFSTTVNGKLYYFGGDCYHDDCYHNSLHELDTNNLTWTQLSPTDDKIGVMKRAHGGMMSTEYEGVHCLIIIGGAGSSPSVQLPQAEYFEMLDGNVRTNEQNMYDLSSGEKIIRCPYTISLHTS